MPREKDDNKFSCCQLDSELWIYNKNKIYLDAHCTELGLELTYNQASSEKFNLNC